MLSVLPPPFLLSCCSLALHSRLSISVFHNQFPNPSWILLSNVWELALCHHSPAHLQYLNLLKQIWVSEASPDTLLLKTHISQAQPLTFLLAVHWSEVQAIKSNLLG